MKGIKGIKTLSALLAVVFSMALCSTSTALGASEQPCTVMIDFELEDVQFDLYRIGNIADNGKASLVDELSDYNVDLYDKNAAYTLSLYLRRDAVAPEKTTFTDGKGDAYFDELEKGVYLILGNDVISGNEKYSFLPVMLSLPMKEGNEYLYDVNVNSKFEKNPVDDTLVDLSVIKIWKNGSDSTNPSITVQLLRDYEVFDTVTLSKENSWKYTWNDLDSKYNWSVTEVKPNVDCIVDIGRDKNLFTITNTIIVPDASTVPETTNPEEQVTTSPSATTPSTIPNETIVKPTVPRTTVPKSGSTPSTKNSVSGGTIPQTGQLNWPVPVLIAVGIILIAIGIVFARKKTNE